MKEGLMFANVMLLEKLCCFSLMTTNKNLIDVTEESCASYFRWNVLKIFLYT